MENLNALVPVALSPMRSPKPYSRRTTTEDTKILHSLNFKLQFKVHNLENEVVRLKEEVQGYKGKSFIYESLTRDLASLRSQLDKTALALLKKCEAHDMLKKELTSLKIQYNISPKSSQQTPKKLGSPNKGPSSASGANVKRKLAIYQEIMGSSDNLLSNLPVKMTSRSSMGSCGNLIKQISDEEAMPSCLKAYAALTAPLRNRVLMKLHTLKSASTESLESVGRKSIKAQEARNSQDTTKPIKPTSVVQKANKPNLNSSLSASRGGNVIITPNAPRPIRPALGQSNGRVIRINTGVKKSNSSCSAKGSKPAFRF